MGLEIDDKGLRASTRKGSTLIYDKEQLIDDYLMREEITKRLEKQTPEFSSKYYKGGRSLVDENT